MPIRLVCGPPASGKSTWVRAQAAAGATVIDLDQIITELGGDPADEASPIRDHARQIRAGREAVLDPTADAWVIRTLADPADRADTARRLGATEVHVLDIPADECSRRAAASGRPAWTGPVITDWWANYQPNSDDIRHGDAMHRRTLNARFLRTGPNGEPNPGTPAGGGGAATGAPGAGGPGGTGANDQGQQPQDPGFPAETPLTEMTVEQREAYWKHHARRHENALRGLGDTTELQRKAKLYDDAEAAKLTPSDQAVNAAREEGRQAALAEANQQTVTAILQANLAARGQAEDDIADIVVAVNPAAFITDGKVDTAKVTAYANRIAGAPAGSGQQQKGRVSDMGQGHRGNNRAPSGADAGRAEAAKRYPKQSA